MTSFLLNDREVTTALPAGTILLDFIRYHQHLTGTKIGCREGDCGACTVLIGELQEEGVRYRSFTACITPIGNVRGRHVVTIEGLNGAGLTPVQQAMTDCGATQCGFCTPGFVVSLTGFCLSGKEATLPQAIAAIDGNICRCTGYKSIENAAAIITKLMQAKGRQSARAFAVEQQIIPGYFLQVDQRLQQLQSYHGNGVSPSAEAVLLGGGTDLYVQQPAMLQHNNLRFQAPDPLLRHITVSGDHGIIGPAATVTDLHESPLIQKAFPHFSRQVKAISSTPIRNMATIAGNFVNASPIGDFSVFFLAAGAIITLGDGERSRELPLREFFVGYKQLNREPGEKILGIRFPLPGPGTRVHFEKVSKRTHLDIASVNSAIFLTVEEGKISAAGLAAGGVAPVPLYLKETSAFLVGKTPDEKLVLDAVEVAQAEISPISDVRGSAAYKRLLLAQLIKAHFLTLFPELDARLLLQPAGSKGRGYGQA